MHASNLSIILGPSHQRHEVYVVTKNEYAMHTWTGKIFNHDIAFYLILNSNPI